MVSRTGRPTDTPGMPPFRNLSVRPVLRVIQDRTDGPIRDQPWSVSSRSYSDSDWIGSVEVARVPAEGGRVRLRIELWGTAWPILCPPEMHRVGEQ